MHTDGAQLYADGAWWTLLLLLQPVLHRCSAGQFLLGAGATIPARPPGTACAERQETGRAWGMRKG